MCDSLSFIIFLRLSGSFIISKLLGFASEISFLCHSFNQIFLPQRFHFLNKEHPPYDYYPYFSFKNSPRGSIEKCIFNNIYTLRNRTNFAKIALRGFRIILYNL